MKRPHRHAYGPLETKTQERHSRSRLGKARVRRWEKRVQRRLAKAIEAGS
jgi:hypothetical protein